MMDYVLARLTYGKLKCKKKKILRWECHDGIAIKQRYNSFSHHGTNCIFIVTNRATLRIFVTKQRKKKQENAKNAKDDDDYAFLMHNRVHI